MPAVITTLLGDLSAVPRDYIREVADTKRVLERLTMDPSFRDAFAQDARAAIASLGVRLNPDQVTPFIAGAGLLPGIEQVAAEGEHPLSVLRYRAFLQEKLAYRLRTRRESEPSHPRMAAWRARQVNRCRAELGEQRESAIIHAPAALELSQGCTVGCWFCGVAAPKFDRTWRYSPGSAALWRGTLAAIRDVVGDGAKHGFLYWATDPLDNPDYERFLADFRSVLGRCPPTTTAQPHKDPERTRKLLRLSRSYGAAIDRFSIIGLNSLYRVHEEFSPAEMLRVECVPQNREASPVYRKSNAGRARKFAHRRPGELNGPGEGATIACVSGFLLNMVDRSVRLITPCAASDRWPLGYWVLGQGTFGDAAELRELLEHMIEARMRVALSPSDVVRLARGVRLVAEGTELRALSRGPAVVVRDQPDAGGLAALLAGGSPTAGQIALRRQRTAGVPQAETLSLLDHLFGQGLLDEEPPVPESPGPPKEVIDGTAEAM